ncbi:MAG TPA: ABC transporter permease subunit [Chloroflexota bacterium]|nr:ABC transporter permease subunit [Chloroflexota bacterium]
MLPAGCLYCLFVLFPLAQVVWLSLHRGNAFSLDAYRALWADPTFHISLANTVGWEIAAVLVPTALALPIALAVARGRPGPLIPAVLILPLLLPPIVVAALWTLLYSPAAGPLAVTSLPSPDFLGDPRLALPSLFVAWLWSVLGIGALLLYAGLTRIGREWGEGAEVEGAGPLWRLIHITLPALRPVIAVTAAVNAALALQVFDLIFAVTGGGPGNATMLLPLEVYGRVFGGRPAQGDAAAALEAALGVALALAAAGAWGRSESFGGEPPERRSALGAILAAVAAVIAMLPILWLVPISLAPGRSALLGGIDVSRPTLSNLSGVLTLGLGGALAESAVLALIAVAGVLVLSYPAAFALAERTFPRQLRLAALALLVIGLFQGTSAILPPLFSLLISLGLLDSVWGIVLPEIAQALPLAVLVIWGMLRQMPREIGESAEVDGAGPWRRLVAISLPQARPALIVAGVWAFATSWNAYLLPLIVSQGVTITTVPTFLAGLIGRSDTQYGLLAAGSLIAVLPVVAAALLLRSARAVAGVLR